jgi:hypothetical protein
MYNIYIYLYRIYIITYIYICIYTHIYIVYIIHLFKMLKMPKAYFPVHLVVNVVAIGGPLSLLAIGGLAISGSPVADLLGVEAPCQTAKKWRV